MSKRPADDQPEMGESSGQPPPKKVQFEPMRIGPVSTLEEMDMKVLHFQNKKLAQRLDQRYKVESDLRKRIEQLEKRQIQDDAVLNVINRYWNQLNEDVRVLLQRFDAETADESESKNENEATTSFLTQLSTWDKEELDDKLACRVQVSKRAVAKIIQAFDRLMQRNEKVTLILKGEVMEGDTVPNLDEAIKETNIQLMSENRKLQELNTTFHEKQHSISLKMAEAQEKVTAKETEIAELQNRVDDLQYELQKTQQRNDKVEHHLAETLEKLKSYQPVQAEEKTKCEVTSISQKKLEELEKDVEEQKELATNRLLELEKLHQDHKECLKEVEKLKMDIRQLPESVIVETTEYKCLQSQFSVLYNESMQLKTQLEDTRLQLQTSKNAHLRQIEQMESEELLAQKKLRTEVIQLEDMLAQVRKEYEMLRIEFEQNLAANEQTGPINREMRHLITSLQNHNQQLKGEVYRYKKKYKEILHDIVRVRRELEDLHAKHQEVISVKESSTSTQESCVGGSNNNGGANTNNVKEEEEVLGENSNSMLTGNGMGLLGDDAGASTSSSLLLKKELDEDSELIDDSINISSGCLDDKSDIMKSPVKKEVNAKGGKEAKKEVKVEKDHRDREIHRLKEARAAESEVMRDLKAQLKKALNDQKEMKLLLDMYKGVSKEQRDKVQLMAAEKKARAEIEELRVQMKKTQDGKHDERKKVADEDALRKIRSLEDQIHNLQKQVGTQKQVSEFVITDFHQYLKTLRNKEEEALLNEMEVTGQAFEDMQEQNSRLIQQLREKDDANFKLMSERIKSNQLHKLAREEKEIVLEQVNTLTTQVEAQNQVVRKLEEKERILQNNLATVEKELTLRQQAMEMHKRKAIESAQSAADLKLHLEKYHGQVKEAHQVVAEKTSAVESESYKARRLQEEIAQLKRKLERLKKIELAGTADEVMLEEVREYKDILTCPSCKVKRKDAVLSKCFHVFCFDCLRTRYETRQRKCPKCNAAFGANDYHRLYLS